MPENWEYFSMKALLDKRDLCMIEGLSKRTIERRIAGRPDFPKPTVGNPETNARVQWLIESVIEWYEAHPEVIRHPRAVVEYVIKQKRPKKKQSNAKELAAT